MFVVLPKAPLLKCPRRLQGPKCCRPARSSSYITIQRHCPSSLSTLSPCTAELPLWTAKVILKQRYQSISPRPDSSPLKLTISFRHPGYDDPEDILLTLPRLDSHPQAESAGVHHGTALLACQIIANNALDGYLATDREGTDRVSIAPDGILLDDSYWFIVAVMTDKSSITTTTSFLCVRTYMPCGVHTSLRLFPSEGVSWSTFSPYPTQRPAGSPRNGTTGPSKTAHCTTLRGHISSRDSHRLSSCSSSPSSHTRQYPGS